MGNVCDRYLTVVNVMYR